MNEENLPQSYEKFALSVRNISTNTARYELIGAGRESNVYSLQIDDQVYAVKFAQLYFHKR